VTAGSKPAGPGGCRPCYGAGHRHHHPVVTEFRPCRGEWNAFNFANTMFGQYWIGIPAGRETEHWYMRKEHRLLTNEAGGERGGTWGCYRDSAGRDPRFRRMLQRTGTPLNWLVGPDGAIRPSQPWWGRQTPQRSYRGNCRNSLLAARCVDVGVHMGRAQRETLGYRCSGRGCHLGCLTDIGGAEPPGRILTRIEEAARRKAETDAAEKRPRKQ
jgi:hypothetical protein